MMYCTDFINLILESRLQQLGLRGRLLAPESLLCDSVQCAERVSHGFRMHRVGSAMEPQVPGE